MRCAIIIGRFQPFHLGHKKLIDFALKDYDKVIVVIGSHKKARNIKNPWTAEERQDMISNTMNSDRIQFVLMRDYLYNDDLWIVDLQTKISQITDKDDQITIVGHYHDNSSYYLKLFPNFDCKLVENFDEVQQATYLRNSYFTHDNEWEKHVSDYVKNNLKLFKSTPLFTSLKGEFDYIKSYQEQWSGAPFPVTFVTVDNVVVKSGHVLVVKRKCNPGKGLLALPGGFLNSDEKILTSALRELKEETKISLSKEELIKHLVESKVFDHPARSLRGRTITHAFLFNLKYGDLPKVKAADDAEEAFWMPIADVFSNEEKFMEDHWSIIFNFINKL